MRRLFTLTCILIIACTIIISCYGLGYLEEAFYLSGIQTTFLTFTLIAAAAIIVAAAFEYIVSLPLTELLRHMAQSWERKESFEDVDERHLPRELKAVLTATKRTLAASTERIKELESQSGYGDSYYRLVTTMSHQLRTPLTGLRWALGIIHDDLTKGRAPDLELVAGAQSAADRMRTLTEELLIGIRRQDTHANAFAPLDIELQLATVQTESALTAFQRHIPISIITPERPLPLIHGNGQEIRFVLHSLLSNALFYGAPGTPVTIILDHDELNVRVTIHNIGGTIGEKEKHLLFSQFNRGREAIRLNPDGSGMSLYLTKQILIDHAGTISFDSDPVKGTSFTITLPISRTGQLETFINTLQI